MAIVGFWTDGRVDLFPSLLSSGKKLQGKGFLEKEEVQREDARFWGSVISRPRRVWRSDGSRFLFKARMEGKKFPLQGLGWGQGR